MDQTTIEERIKTGYYIPDRPSWDCTRLQETQQLRDLNQAADRLRGEIERKKQKFLREMEKLGNERIAEFKSDCLLATGLKDHPRADQAWDKAWADGHGYGLMDIYYELVELAELLV